MEQQGQLAHLECGSYFQYLQVKEASPEAERCCGKLWQAGRRAGGNERYPAPALCQGLCETLRVEIRFPASGSPGSRSRPSGGMVGSGFQLTPQHAMAPLLSRALCYSWDW